MIDEHQSKPIGKELHNKLANQQAVLEESINSPQP
jgi:hypothetical protein